MMRMRPPHALQTEMSMSKTRASRGSSEFSASVWNDVTSERATSIPQPAEPGDATPDVATNALTVVVDEITLVGSRCGPFEPALRLLREGGVDVMPLVHARYPLQEGVAAFEHAEHPGVLKVLLEVGPV